MKMSFLFLGVLLIISSSFVLGDETTTSEWVSAGSGNMEYTCPMPAGSAEEALLLQGYYKTFDAGDVELECVYKCKGFTWTDPMNVEKTNSAKNGEIRRKISPGGTVEISDIDIRNACCDSNSYVCFSPSRLQCYYTDDIGKCSNSVYTADGSCRCTISLFSLDGSINKETISDCTKCLNLQEQCPSGFFYAGSISTDAQCCNAELKYDDNKCCMHPNKIINSEGSSVCCADYKVVNGQEVCCDSDPAKCTILPPVIIDDPDDFEDPEDGKKDDDDDETKDDDNEENEDDEEDDEDKDDQYDIDLSNIIFSCRSCTKVSNKKARCTLELDASNLPSESFQSMVKYGVIGSDYSQHGDKFTKLIFPEFTYHGGSSIFIKYYVEDVNREVTCTLIASNCQEDGSNGVCPTGCRSWEDPDCNFGPYGSRLWAATLGNFIPVQEWWNEQLSNEDTLIGAVYSFLDEIPGSVEWWTARMCDYGLEMTDEEVCGSVGMEGNCSENWSGSENFIDSDVVVSIAAEYITGESKYRFSWRLNNMPDTKYQVSLETYDDFNSLPVEKVVIYPDETETATLYTDVTEGVTNLDYVRSTYYDDSQYNRYEKVCLHFKSTDGDFWQKLINLFSAGNEPASVCRTIIKR